MSAKADAVRGNPVLPPPIIPKKVLDSNIIPPPIIEEAPISTLVVDEKLEHSVVVDEKAKGMITIYIFENKPYEAKFSGQVTGVELNIAWRAMYKQYKLWKHELLKQGGK
ncbi:hypothetical protein LCGC14_0712640 [marine sediment metagenome]|uniref:Uncharacterized protein n=1 Tax=marine sediment metagenome TaxID=412755 RepID=A0A0F9TM62_9ZZZZ